MLHKYKLFLENAEYNKTPINNSNKKYLAVGAGIAATGAAIGGLMYLKNKKEKIRIEKEIKRIKQIDCSHILKDLHRESCLIDKRLTLHALKEKLQKVS